MPSFGSSGISYWSPHSQINGKNKLYLCIQGTGIGGMEIKPRPTSFSICRALFQYHLDRIHSPLCRALPWLHIKKASKYRQTGKYLAGGNDIRTECKEVPTSLTRAKYFPVRPVLTQLIRISFYDHGSFFFFFWLAARVVFRLFPALLVPSLSVFIWDFPGVSG